MRAIISTITFSAEKTSSTSKNYLCVSFPHSCSYGKPFHFVFVRVRRISLGLVHLVDLVRLHALRLEWQLVVHEKTLLLWLYWGWLVLRLFILAVALHYYHFILVVLCMESCFAKVIEKVAGVSTRFFFSIHIMKWNSLWFSSYCVMVSCVLIVPKSISILDLDVWMSWFVTFCFDLLLLTLLQGTKLLTLWLIKTNFIFPGDFTRLECYRNFR